MTEIQDDDLPEALRGLSAEEAIDPVAVVSHELHRKSTPRRVGEIVGSLSVIAVIFVFVIPAVTGSQYTDIWEQMSRLDALEFAGLSALWFTGMLAYTGVLVNTLPGLRRSQALTVNFAGSAVSNVLPFGGAIGVGATYAIDMSWGFSAPSVTLSILVSGIWNIFAKLGMPILALVLLVSTGSATGKLLVPTLIGLVALIGAIVLLGLVLRSEALALRIGNTAQRIIAFACSKLKRRTVPQVADSILDFRHHSIGLLKQRWWRITIWIIAFNLIQFLLLLSCCRALGIDSDTASWVEIFAAFAFARLLEAVPITPSGVGFVETGAAAALISFGADDTAATAAVFLFRGFTYLLEIPVGSLAWIVWASKRSWRSPQQL
ncbi:unannotated protein [freshwater metagenome]|uniref:Unannotated protein n=1 Tax=freshwater metagenome TaxID=449393 RepID=A0A6J6IM21_9ZZZZ